MMKDDDLTRIMVQCTSEGGPYEIYSSPTGTDKGHINAFGIPYILRILMLLFDNV